MKLQNRSKMSLKKIKDEIKRLHELNEAGRKAKEIAKITREVEKELPKEKK